MIIWTSKKLEAALLENKLTKMDKILFLVALVGLLFVGVGAVLTGVLPLNLWGGVLLLALSALGLYLSHHTNQTRDGKDFLSRFMVTTSFTLFRFSIVIALLIWGLTRWAPEILHSIWFVTLFWATVPILLFRRVQSLIFLASKPRVSWEAHQGI